MKKFALTALQKEVLTSCGKYPEIQKNFYWTGGTLLAYQYLHHRQSVDIDYFSGDLLTEDQYLILAKDLKKTIHAQKISLTTFQNRHIFLTRRNRDQLKIELVYFPFAAIEKRKKLPKFSVLIDSITDIMVNKTLATYQRQEPKDVFDLYTYFLHKPAYNLFQLLNLVEKKFGISLEPVLLLEKINTLADNLSNLQPLLFEKDVNLSTKVKKYFQNVFNKKVNKEIE